MNAAKRLGRIIAVVVLLIVAAGGVLRLTGTVRYMVTDGVSMTPLYHSGDLVVVRPAARYQVGQIVAYRSQLLHSTVLHRLVAVSGGQYTFKGDHNTWLDPEHPTSGQLVGRAWLHIPHGGVLLALHGAPLLVVAAIAFAALTLLKPQRPARRPRPGRDVHRRLTFGLLAAEIGLGAGLAAALATAHTTTVTTLPAVSEASAFSYSAQTKPGPVYPDGTLQTGDPIFVHVVPAVTVTYDYQASGYLGSDIRGTTALSMALSSASGWHDEVALGPPTAVTAGHARVEAPIDLASLEATLAQVRSLTGVDTGMVALVIHAVTDVTGASGRSDHVDTPLNLQMTPTEVSLTGQAGGSGGSQPIVSRRAFPQAASSPPPAPATAGVGRRARDPLIVAMVIVTILLGLHFYPTSPYPRGEAERQAAH